MAAARIVSADPHRNDDASLESCFACNLRSSRKPYATVYFSASQLSSHASIDTGNLENPFRSVQMGRENCVSIRLCTACRDKKTGWKVIVNPRRYKLASKRALQAWRTRCSPHTSRVGVVECVICASLSKSTQNASQENGTAQRARHPTRDWSLFNITSNRQEVKNAFTTELCRLSTCPIQTVMTILADPSKVFFCTSHLNHCRYARLSAKQAELSDGGANGFCMFQEYCGWNKIGGLWKVPVLDTDNLSNMETFSQLEDSVYQYSRGNLHAVDVMGKRCCRTCLYIVSEGQKGTKPSVHINSLSSTVDRWTVRCIYYALEDISALDNGLFDVGAPIPILGVAVRLRNSCIVSTVGRTEIRMIPFQEVRRCRDALCSFESIRGSFATSLHHKTLETRIEGVLAGKGIILKKLSYKLRCYVSAGLIDKMLTGVATQKEGKEIDTQRPSAVHMRNMLDDVSKLFSKNRDKYWKGTWSLPTEVYAIPAALWADVVLMMASERRLRLWSITARASSVRLHEVFPVCNAIEKLPKSSIEDALNYRGSTYPRADMLICVRALKVIEKIVLSRTNGIAGPLTVSASVSGICEVSPSFVSVLNAMGLFLSYSVTEQYRQRLISERESIGPWDTRSINPVAMPILQFDNWDISPLHAVKVDGKSMPKVNGSLLQGGTKKRGRDSSGDITEESKRQRASGWRDVSELGDRDYFVESYTNVENTEILKQFNYVVFGLACLYRKGLLGGRDADTAEYNTGVGSEFENDKHNERLNFRTLLLSAFKPHGGRPETDASLYNQHVVYVEISRDSAVDILTVRRFLNLIEEQIQPGREGRPRYITVGGYQPSYKMFCELWIKSWRDSKLGEEDNGTLRSNSNLQLHEWLIPFPGFFLSPASSTPRSKLCTPSARRCLMDLVCMSLRLAQDFQSRKSRI